MAHPRRVAINRVDPSTGGPDHDSPVIAAPRHDRPDYQADPDQHHAVLVVFLFSTALRHKQDDWKNVSVRLPPAERRRGRAPVHQLAVELWTSTAT